MAFQPDNDCNNLTLPTYHRFASSHHLPHKYLLSPLSATNHRLDTPEFWRALPGPPQHWQELTGPADPLLLRGTVRLGAQAGAAAGGGGGGGWCGAPAVVGGGGGFGEDDTALVSEDSLVVVLEITNRCEELWGAGGKRSRV